MTPEHRERLHIPIPWITVERPGYFGKQKDAYVQRWNATYGADNWRLVWQTTTGEVLHYEDIITEYIAGYAAYFRAHPDEASYLTAHFAYGYDKEMQSKPDAFDPYALYQKPGRPNQFHHVAFNLALEQALNMPFRGSIPIQVRAAKPGTPRELWPSGAHWQPGRIPSTRPHLIHQLNFPEQWWEKGSIEDFYQSNKALQCRIIPVTALD